MFLLFLNLLLHFQDLELTPLAIDRQQSGRLKHTVELGSASMVNFFC